MNQPVFASIPSLAMISERDAFLNVCLLAARAHRSEDSFGTFGLESFVQRLASPGIRAEPLEPLESAVDLSSLAGQFESWRSRHRAMESAICICHADGTVAPTEESFLANLQAALGLSAGYVADLREQAEAILTTPWWELSPPIERQEGRSLPSEITGVILHYAVLAGALELLPQPSAALALTPLQMKAVHQIAKRFGANPERDQVSAFLNHAGLGFTSQAAEIIVRKVLGESSGSPQAEQPGETRRAHALTAFANTCALGQLARHHFGSPAGLSESELRRMMPALADEARFLQPRYAAAMRARALQVRPRELETFVLTA